MKARTTIGAVLLALATTAAAGDANYTRMRALAERDEATVPAAESEAFVTRQGEVAGKAVMACFDASNPPKRISLAVVMELGADGRVVRTWRRDDDRLTACVAGMLAGQHMWTPPQAPFYSFVQMDLDVKAE
jgi:hypothetical protein